MERKKLPKRVSNYLESKQQKVNVGKDVRVEWERARATKTIGESLFGILLRMAGKRERCMFCNDSRGTDIDHFWPKVPYPKKAFHWENMLLVCTGCNRKKGDRMPLDGDGTPLLIDPSIDNPWIFLVFIPETGELAPRWRIDLNAFDPKGKATIDPSYLPLNIEAVSLGRQRTFNNLAKVVKKFLEDIEIGNDAEAAFLELSQQISEHSDYGLEYWLFHFDGSDEEPFTRLRVECPDYWKKLKGSIF